MLSLHESFLGIRARETAGSRTGDRFQYQWNWALSHVLELHKSGEEYLVAFDYHDDVIDFDSGTNPTAIRFYQVKTKEKGAWRLSDLLRRNKGKSSTPENPHAFLLSHIGKMYSNKVLFPDNTKSATFVTNAPLSLRVISDENPRRIIGAQLLPEDLAKIAKQMIEEHNLPGEPDLGDLLVFEQSALTIEDHITQLKGRLIDFLENLYPNHKFQIGAIYRALIGEVTIRSRPGVGPPSTFHEFVQSRCIGRTQFEELLTAIGIGPEPLENLWAKAETQLGIEQMKPLRIKAIGTAWRKHEINRRDPRKQSVRELSAAVHESLSKLKLEDEAHSMTLCQLIEKVVEDETVRQKSRELFDSDYVRAVAVMEFYES